MFIAHSISLINCQISLMHIQELWKLHIITFNAYFDDGKIVKLYEKLF